MRPPKRHLAPAVALVLVLTAALAIGCGVGTSGGGGGSDGSGGRTVVVGDVSLDTTTTTAPTPDGRSFGDVPPRVDRDPAVALRTCEVDEDGDRVLVEAVVVNTTGSPQLLQGLPVTIRDEAGDVISSDDADLWSSITIGPGRQALHRDEIDVDGPVRSVTCELGEPDLRPERLGGGDEVDADDVELTGCSPLQVTVENRSDRPVGVAVQVEAFDDQGNSAGTFELGQYPTTYTDGREPSDVEVALPAGETGEYSVDPNQRLDEYRTPLDGEITACEIVTTSLVVDPEPTEVIVD